MNKNTWIAVVLAIVVVGFFLFGNTVVDLFSNPEQGLRTMNEPAQGEGVPQAPQDLVIQDDVVGTGDEAVAGSTVTVNYVGMLQTGQVFDASANHGGPFQFTIGAGQVIAGWEQGIAGMKVGGKRTLIIPPSLGYGNQNVGPIPANSTLVFQVELLGVEN